MTGNSLKGSRPMLSFDLVIVFIQYKTEGEVVDENHLVIVDRQTKYLISIGI